MRKNIQRVIEAWQSGHKHNEKTCNTDGQTIWSYYAPIAHRIGKRVWLANSGRSVTTSAQLDAITESLKKSSENYEVYTVDPHVVGRLSNCSSEDCPAVAEWLVENVDNRYQRSGRTIYEKGVALFTVHGIDDWKQGKPSLAHVQLDALVKRICELMNNGTLEIESVKSILESE